MNEETEQLQSETRAGQIKVMISPPYGVTLVVTDPDKGDLTIPMSAEDAIALAGMVTANATIVLNVRFNDQMKMMEEEAQIRAAILNPNGPTPFPR